MVDGRPLNLVLDQLFSATARPTSRPDLRNLADFHRDEAGFTRAREKPWRTAAGQIDTSSQPKIAAFLTN
jgi:hypothetical protein